MDVNDFNIDNICIKSFKILFIIKKITLKNVHFNYFVFLGTLPL